MCQAVSRADGIRCNVPMSKVFILLLSTLVASQNYLQRTPSPSSMESSSAVRYERRFGRMASPS